MSQPDPIHLADVTAKEIRDGAHDTAILPIGATEHHGGHLPFSTDTVTASALASRFAAELGAALVLPPLPYGVSLHLMAWPWTMSLRPATLTATVVDIGESLLRHGIARLLVVSAHDGNPAPAEAAARELNDRHGMTVAVFSGWQGLARRLLAGVREIDEDHGGQSEMSMTLLLAPDLARIDRAVDLPNQQTDHPVRVYGPFRNVVPHGYSGRPAQGTAEEGQAILDAIASHVSPFLRQLSDESWTNGEWMSGLRPE